MLHSLLLLALAFPLEWNATYRTDVPYEVEVNPVKLGAAGFVVKADGRPLKTSFFPGKTSETVALRFSVPRGTKALTCETTADGGARAFADASLDNLFAGALDEENLAKWELPKGVKAVRTKDGVVFAADETAAQLAWVAYTVDLPEGLAGKPAMQEIEVTNLGKLVWGGRTRVEQLDGEGKPLPETLADCRWTMHMRPPQKTCTYRDEGHFHPRARKLRFVADLNRSSAEFDAYGQPIADRSARLPSLSLTRLAVRPAAELPFPKWNDAFFGEGVSGAEGDASFKMGGPECRAFAYQLRSRAGWTQRHQFRREEDCYFPVRDGTVEAWFKPDFSTNAKVVFFEGYQNYLAEIREKGHGTVLRLGYDAKDRRLSILMCDWKGRKYEQTFDGVTVPEGRWTHVALQWAIGGAAEAFVDGRLVASMPIPEFTAVPIEDPNVTLPNDRWAVELYFGSDCRHVRFNEGTPKREDGAFMDGEGDNLRVSSGCRYRDGFVPEKVFRMDAATRALFTFDRTFDGESSGGFGFVPGTVLSTDDRVDHRVKAEDGQTIQYYPAELLPENDPHKVFDIVNYPTMPSERDYRVARRLCSGSFDVKSGDRVEVTTGAEACPAYVEIENTSSDRPLRYPILVRDGAFDPRSFGDLRDSFPAQGMSDRARADAIFQYVIGASDYFCSYQTRFRPGRDEPEVACYDAMLVLNGYCGFECGPLNNMTANMFATVAGCPAGQTRGYGHEFEQVFYDGKNHVYDLSAQQFFPAMDNETAGYLKELGDQPGAIRRSGRSPDHFVRCGTRPSFVLAPSYQEKFGMTLNPGEKMRVWFANDAQFNNLFTSGKSGVYGTKELGFDVLDYARVTGADDSQKWVKRVDRVIPQYSTAVITFDGRPAETNPAFGDFAADSFVYRVRSCYPVVYAEYAAYLKDGAAAPLEVSTDGGRTFSALPSGDGGVTRLEYRVKARHAYLVRVKAPAADVVRFTARTEGMVNPRTYPGWVKPGKNGFVFKAEPGGVAKVSVGWREPVKEVVVAGTARSGAIPGCERELVVVDPARPLVLDVKGLSASARTVTHGRLKATLANGKLTLAYDATKGPAIRRGDDNPEARGEFPTVAAVDLVDGEAVKTVTAIVSPNARLAVAGDVSLSAGPKPFAYEKLPAGRYAVFSLCRYVHRGSGHVVFDNPADPKGVNVIARPIDGFFDYLKAQYARPGERARWKWDTDIRTDRQGSAGGFSLKLFDLPETDHLDLRLRWPGRAEAPECQAVLIVPEPDVEARLELRKILFGLNCDPFHVN